MSNAMPEPTQPKVPDFAAVAQATSGPSIATLVHADSARNTIGVDASLINSQPPPMVAPSTAPTVPDRPPAAPDPVTGIILHKTHVHDFTSEPQLAYPPEETALAVHVIGNSFVPSSPTPSLVITNAPGHAIASMIPSVTQHHPDGENPTHHLHAHWKLPTANGEHQSPYLHKCTCDVAKDNGDSNSLLDTLNLEEDSICSDLAIHGNDGYVPSYAAVFGQPTVGKCILDLLVEPPLVEPPLAGTVPGNDENSMAPIDLWTNLNDPVDLVHEDHLLPSNNVPLLAHGITFPLASPCIGARTLLPQDTTLATNEKSQEHHDYYESLQSQCTLPVSYMAPTACTFAKPYASYLHGIEEEIMFSSSSDKEEYDDEDILLAIEPCIPFAMQLFPHHDDIFLQALYDLVPSSMEMTHRTHVLCPGDFSDGEPSPVIATKPTVKKPALGEQELCRSPKNSTGLLSDVSHSSSKYYQPIGDVLVTVTTTAFWDLEDGDFPNAPYPQDEDIPVRNMAHIHGSKYTKFPVLPFVCIKVAGYTQGIHMSFKIPCVTKLFAPSFTVYGMLTPLPFDRGKMVSNLSPSYLYAASLQITSRPYQASLVHLSLPPWRALKCFCSHVIPYSSLWGVTTRISPTLHEPLPSTVSTCTLTLPECGLPQESHVLFLTSSNILPNKMV